MKTTIVQRQAPSPGILPAKPAAPAQRISVTGMSMREEKIAITYVTVNTPKAKSKVQASARRAKIKARS